MLSGQECKTEKKVQEGCCARNNGIQNTTSIKTIEGNYVADLNVLST